VRFSVRRRRGCGGRRKKRSRVVGWLIGTPELRELGGSFLEGLENAEAW
jgi:hypothetical protein